jgi:hypothetical protein
MRFFRSKRSRPPAAAPTSRWPELLETFRTVPSDLMVIIGPEDGGSVCSDWIGAVVSVGGRNEYFPALVDAVEDGVFHATCRHNLIPFRREEGEAEVLFCTKLALAAMVRRRNNVAGSRRSEKAGLDDHDRFGELYEEARVAEKEGRLADAMDRCQAALHLLRDRDLFGENQNELARILKGRMQTILRAEADRARPRAGGG